MVSGAWRSGGRDCVIQGGVMSDRGKHERARLERARRGWRYTGEERPRFAIEPGPDQESVWDYPRPPRIEPERRRVKVYAGDVLLAESDRAFRVLETASPPTVYVPPSDVAMHLLQPRAGATSCEWKGQASYYDVVTAAERIPRAAWSYATPFPSFGDLAGSISFYPQLLRCFLGGERVRPQPGGFYGGWLTSEIVGPVKGEPGARE
jgi:uncharacterized protein (DUF427 family)